MKNLFYTLATSITIIGLNTLPSQAINEQIEIKVTNNIQSERHQIENAITSNGCYYIPGYGLVCN